MITGNIFLGYDNSIMIGVQKREFFGIILCFLLLSRVVAEALNTFVWDKTNQVWSVVALGCFGAWLWPLLVMQLKRRSNIFVDYWPVFVYIAFLLTRIRFEEFYSVKCFLSELIVWFIFIFTLEVCSRESKAAEMVRSSVVWVVKIIVAIGLVQLMIFMVRNANFNPSSLIESRPVQGIFIHQSICLIMIMPFFLYFMKYRSYMWLFLILLVSVFTGTRTLFLGTICMFIPIVKSFFKRKIKWVDIILTLLIIFVGYGTLIKMNSYGWSWENEDTRLSFSTVQWRVHHWKGLLEESSADLSVLIGKGVGSADFHSDFTKDRAFPPHNDYLRIYYDLGIVGLLLYINLIIFIIRSLMRSQTPENDFIVLMYMFILCFSITDNFLYHTISVLIYMFLASYMIRPSMHSQEKVILKKLD